MPTINRKLPLPDRATSVVVPGGTVDILPYQIVLSVSITHKGVASLHPNSPHFPAVLDTAFNGAFLLQDEHLNQWAGVRREHFRMVDVMHPYSREVPIHAANIWIHCNEPGRRDVSLSLPPFRIKLDPGIGVCPRGLGRPRLPLLGLRALQLADLQLYFHWRKQSVSLYTTPWWHKFLGW
jgi:hypothetical protein